jgi:tripartite-type tricarboxylate transporter receptor subunit TctC
MTERNSVRPLVGIAAIAVGLLIPGVVRAADFYSGKTITFVVSSDAGGGYDTYTRFLARYMQKYIPGTPSIVVQDEPGGGGLRGAQDIYAVGDKDGTKIGLVRAGNMLDSILGVRGEEIDPNKYEWIGNMASDTDVCTFSYASGVRSFEDLKTRQVLVGASGTGSQGYDFPNAINYTLHTQMKIITGYKGTADRILAMQQGELQGACGINASSLTRVNRQQITDGKLIPVIQSGLHPYPALSNVPLTQSFATTDAQRRILVTIFSQMEIARVFAAPPGTPKDRVEILRKAFMQALSDQTLIDEAKKLKLDIQPMSGEDVTKVVAEMSDLSPELKAAVRAAIGD